VQVSNHLRPWLHTLLLLSSNSPFFDGYDTGHVSWRSVVRSRWPVSGVPPYFRSAQDYLSLVDTLVDANVILDAGMVYWHVRPATRLPTIEVRVSDVAATAGEAVLLAGLIRALVSTALTDIDRGHPAPRPLDQLLHAACWRAAWVGLSGQNLDPLTGRATTGWALVDQLTRHVRPALLASGDLTTVTRVLEWLRTHGCGAARQRAELRRAGSLSPVVDFLAEQTQRDLFS
jgi:carboxylate-amine ligase